MDPMTPIIKNAGIAATKAGKTTIAAIPSIHVAPCDTPKVAGAGFAKSPWPSGVPPDPLDAQASRLIPLFPINPLNVVLSSHET